MLRLSQFQYLQLSNTLAIDFCEVCGQYDEACCYTTQELVSCIMDEPVPTTFSDTEAAIISKTQQISSVSVLKE